MVSRISFKPFTSLSPLIFLFRVFKSVNFVVAILTATKLLPKNSKATIYSDSQVAIQVLSKNYKGFFQLFYKEFKKAIRNRNLQINLKKVKGHEDIENIKVDHIAKASLTLNTIFDIRQLFGQVRLLTKSDVIIFDHRHLTKNVHKERMKSYLEDHPNQINHGHWRSPNIKFLKEKIAPKNKYAVWRNITDSHIEHFTGSYCPDCETESDLQHYIYECPKLDSAKYFCEQKISALINCKVEISTTPTWYNPSINRLFIHHSGILPNSGGFREASQLDKHWPEIQMLLALLVGRCHKYYYQDRLKE